MGNIATVCGRGKVRPTKGKKSKKRRASGEGPAEAAAEAAAAATAEVAEVRGGEEAALSEVAAAAPEEVGREEAAPRGERHATGSGPMEVDTEPLPLNVRNREAEEGIAHVDAARGLTGVASHRLNGAEKETSTGPGGDASKGGHAPAEAETATPTPSKPTAQGRARGGELPAEVPPWVSRVLVPAGAFLGLVVGNAVRRASKRDEYYEPVREGSCLYRIGVENETTVDDIAKANDDRHGISLTPNHEFGHYSEEFYGFGDPNLIWPAEEFHKAPALEKAS